MPLSLLHYSPTGGTIEICRQMGLRLNPQAAEYHLSQAKPQELTFAENNAVLVPVPVFGGRMPTHAAQAVRHLYPVRGKIKISAEAKARAMRYPMGRR